MARILRLAHYALFLLLVGCSSLAPLPTTPTPVPVLEATSTPQSIPTSTASVTANQPRVLRVWLPPQFDPTAGTPSADLLRQRLLDYESEHPGIQIEVRVKSDADILNTLAITSHAAPEAMPDLIALSCSDMQAIASAGFLHPLDGLTSVLQDPDWYAFARELGHLKNTEYGIPFASDVLTFLHRPTSIIEPPISWNSIINSGNGMAIPVSDPQALFTLSLYMSDGGQFVNANGMPGLDEEPLIRVLTFYQRTIESGVLPLTAREFKTDKDVLNYYHTGGADLVVIRASSDMQIWSGEYITLLGLEDAPYAIGDGWVWALAGSNVENQPLAVELASYLVDSNFMSEWTLASGVLPTRPQAVDRWNDQLLKFSVNEILRAAHPIPSDDVVSIVGPLLQGALVRVFNGEQPEVVARSVVENLK